MKVFVGVLGCLFAIAGIYQTLTGTHDFGSARTLIVDIGLVVCAVLLAIPTKKKGEA